MSLPHKYAFVLHHIAIMDGKRGEAEGEERWRGGEVVLCTITLCICSHAAYIYIYISCCYIYTFCTVLWCVHRVLPLCQCEKGMQRGEEWEGWEWGGVIISRYWCHGHRSSWWRWQICWCNSYVVHFVPCSSVLTMFMHMCTSLCCACIRDCISCRADWAESEGANPAGRMENRRRRGGRWKHNR